MVHFHEKELSSMPIYNCPYNPDGPDFVKMWRLLQQDYARRKDNFVWLVSRFGDWKYGCWREAKYFPMFFRRNAQVWLDSFDEVNGFVLSEDGENIFFIFTRPGYDYLYGEILDWTVANWGPRYASLQAEVNEGQADALATLVQSAALSTWARPQPRVPTSWPSRRPPAVACHRGIAW